MRFLSVNTYWTGNEELEITLVCIGLCGIRPGQFVTAIQGYHSESLSYYVIHACGYFAA